MVCIYKITSPIGKIYIGQTADLKKRIAVHKSSCGSTFKSNKLDESFMTYGFDNHIFEVIIECKKSDLNEKERYYQLMYNCTGKNGLNTLITRNDYDRMISGINKIILQYGKESVLNYINENHN